MRHLPLLLVLLLLSTLAAAPAAPASPLPLVDQIRPLILDDEEEGEAEEAEAEEAEADEAEVERELCEEDPEFCEEEAEPRGKGKDKGQDDECVLKNAGASVTLNPGKRRLRLTVHYRTLKPASVSVEASLEGPKGMVHLGTDHARFHRSGVYRDTFSLAEKQAKKALGAREFSVELHVVNEPVSCGLELTGASRRAKR
jgi:hypothetical protein